MNMGTTRFSKMLTVIGAMLSGGLSIGLISMVPETVEATRALN